jgi:hypothetical protein
MGKGICFNFHYRISFSSFNPVAGKVPASCWWQAHKLNTPKGSLPTSFPLIALPRNTSFSLFCIILIFISFMSPNFLRMTSYCVTIFFKSDFWWKRNFLHKFIMKNQLYLFCVGNNFQSDIQQKIPTSLQFHTSRF